MLNFDYKLIRDQGVSSLMPFIEYVSTETLIIAAFTWRWSSVTDEQRGLMRAELLRRGFPELTVRRAEEELVARNLALREEWSRERSKP